MNQKLRDDKDAIEAAHEAVRVGEPTIDPPGSQYLLVDFFWVLALVINRFLVAARLFSNI